MDPLAEWSFVGEVKTWRLRRVKVLGRGSFGVATLVRDLDVAPSMSGRALFVAKEISLGSLRKPSELEALEREIRILRQVNHPNVVAYVDSSAADDERLRSPLTPTLTILMEYCDQGDLHDLISLFGKSGIPDSQVTSLLIQVLVGLRHLHLEHRILHRDLKPQNIFLTSAGIAKIGDFGVSTTLAHSADFARTFCGSPYYLSPELCEEMPYNGKADLWAVGVVFYECLAKGQKPFPAKNLVALILQITKANFDRAPLAGRSSELVEIIESLLQRQAVNRPTFARLLRNPYLTRNLSTLPAVLLASESYQRTFGLDKIDKALAESRSGAEVKSHGGRTSPMTAELLEWAEHDRQALYSLEASRGLVVNGVSDDMTEREKRQLHSHSRGPAVATSRQGEEVPVAPSSDPRRPQALRAGGAKGPTNGGGSFQRQVSESSPSLGTSTANATTLTSTDDDEVWNSRYEDDGFEDAECEANAKHATQRRPQYPATARAPLEPDWEADERLEAAAYAEWKRQDSVPLCETSFNFS